MKYYIMAILLIGILAVFFYAESSEELKNSESSEELKNSESPEKNREIKKRRRERTLITLGIVVFSTMFDHNVGHLWKDDKKDIEMIKDTAKVENSINCIENETINSKQDFIFPDSSENLIDEKDLFNLDSYELMIARNEIFARRHYIFESEDLKEYFESKDWYKGYINSKDFNYDKMLNDIEKENIVLIKKYEDKFEKER